MSAGAPGIFIGGEWRERKGTLEARNPARPSEVVGVFAEANAADVADACGTAREALAGWRHRSALERGSILYQAAEILRGRADRIASELTREEGKPIGEARAEVTRSVAVLRYFAGEAAQPLGETYPSAAPERLLYTQRDPLGVVGVITPWNFPIAIPIWKIAPALAFGNTVVWKPSVVTPVTSASVIELLDEAGVPPGVLNLVTGGRDPVGQALAAAPELDGLSFTGSLGVGRAIQRQLVDRGVKVQLELGGKNPVIVMPDADLDRAVSETVNGAMRSAGQKCTATSRAIVVGGGADAFSERLVRAVEALRVGDPLQPEIDVGPLSSERQLRTVSEYLDVAREEGHRLEAGGSPLEIEGGYFVAPTVYADVAHTSRIAREEVFGPLLGVISADSVEEAIEIANSVEYGLSASIFTRDIGRALEFVRHVDAGIVHVNSETAGSEPQVPFGGMKSSSSHSREQGKSAREFYTAVKTVYVDPPTA